MTTIFEERIIGLSMPFQRHAATSKQIEIRADNAGGSYGRANRDG